MMEGCIHDPELACVVCRRFAKKNSEIVASIMETTINRALELQAKRAESPAPIAEPQPVSDQRTPEQMRAVIKNTDEPELVKRYIKRELYGDTGAGRKADQQEEAKRRRLVSVQEPDNPKSEKPVYREPHRKEEPFRRPPGMSGRQFKRAKKLIRQGKKVFVQARQNP